MGDRPYDSLAAVYAWLVPDELLEPEDAAAVRAAGLEPERSAYAPDADRYLVTARRSSAGARAG